MLSIVRQGYTCKPRIELGQMCILLLGVDLPDKRLARPGGTHERILTTNKV